MVTQLKIIFIHKLFNVKLVLNNLYPEILGLLLI